MEFRIRKFKMKMNMKKITLLFVLLLFCAAGFAQSGTAGNLKWSLAYGTLTISGKGAMPDYSTFHPSPWNTFRITTAIIEDGVTSIGEYAFGFGDCVTLTSVSISNSVKSIGYRAFSGCFNLASVTIPGSVENIGRYAFSGCAKLTSLTIMEGVTSISDQAFNSCSSLTEVTIPGSVKNIGSIGIEIGSSSDKGYAFAYCAKLASVTMMEGVGNIGRLAFTGCYSLKGITVPGSVESIGAGAFKDCGSLTSVTILDGVKSIGEEAFNNCGSLTNVIIPVSVTGIEKYAFGKCNKLKNVTVEWTTPLTLISNEWRSPFYHNSYDGGGFSDLSACTLHVPPRTLALYKAAPVWNEFGIITEQGNGQANIRVDPLEVVYAVGTLSVNTLRAEVVEIYSASGLLLFRAQKEAGHVAFDLRHLPGGILIARGSSGWVKKIAVRP
jgi:hypothetical protein